MEPLAAEELTQLGAVEIRIEHRGISFCADDPALYRINYSSRVVTRVLAPLLSFPCRDTDQLYRAAKKMDWTQILRTDQSFAVFSNVADSPIRHSHYAALRLKDAVVDHMREHVRSRPNVDRKEPDIWLALHVRKDQATVSLDTSGGSLHRRGYRKRTVEAPLQETLAAAIIRWSEWDGSRLLYDPMCGSGTLLCEALMAYCRIPAALLRESFGFQYLPDFQPEVWTFVKRDALRPVRELPEGLVSGSDLNPDAVAVAKTNIHSFPQGAGVSLKAMDFRRIGELRNRVILCNPPYGIRMGKRSSAAELYKELGDFLKRRCGGSRAYIYFGAPDLISRVGLRPSWKRKLFNGGLEGRLALFEIY